MPGFDDSKWKTGKTPIGKGLWHATKRPSRIVLNGARANFS